jgi:hypothetical protein
VAGRSFGLVHLIADCSATKADGSKCAVQRMYCFSPYYGDVVSKWGLAMNVCGVLEWVSGMYAGNTGDGKLCCDSGLVEAVHELMTLL